MPLRAEDVVFTLDYFKKHPYRWITIDHVSRAEAAGPRRVILPVGYRRDHARSSAAHLGVGRRSRAI